MKLVDIVNFWSTQRRNESGAWIHPEDEAVLTAVPHSFNLDFPVSPYVGNVLDAQVIILGANAGYKADLTPREFEGERVIDNYIARVRDPRHADWSFVSRYYGETNYGHLVASGKAVLVNACAYRSSKITQEPDNKKMIERLASVNFTRRWFLEAVLPMAERSERLVIAKRPGLWKLPPWVKAQSGVVFDQAPVSPRLTGMAWAAVGRWDPQ